MPHAGLATRSVRRPRTASGRHSGSVEGYKYSPANKDSGIVWDEETFREYIKNPKATIPGTKMINAGLKDEQKISDLIAYLKQFDAGGKTHD